MKLKMCNCKQCRHGRDSKHMHTCINLKKRAARSKVRRLLAQGEYEKLPGAVAVGYTD